MAETTFESSFVFDIYSDAAALRSNPSLPGGPCNFVELAHGANGATCGCRRFWSRSKGATQAKSDETMWCMCSHHACFHDDVQAGQVPAQAPVPAQQAAANATATAAAAGQENERPKGNREPLSPVQDLASFQLPSNLGLSLDLPALENIDASIGVTSEDIAKLLEAQGDAPAAPAADGSIPDTLSWGHYLQSQNGPTGNLAPVPSQCPIPSQAPSTTSSSQLRYLRPFAGKGLQTLSSVPRAREPLLERSASESGAGVEAALAAADHAQASVDLTLSPRAATPRIYGTQDLVDPQQPAGSTGVSREAFEQLSNTVQSHEQRLDKLEDPSFSVTGHDECQEKHDYMDLRVIELESRVEEVEKRLNDDNNSTIASKTRDIDDDATISVISAATDATARALDRSEMYSQIQALQAQVDSLQASSLPTYTRPWELEVVYLPFSLKGVWLSSSEFSTQAQAGAGDEWTQLPSTLSRQTPDPQSPSLGRQWADLGSHPGWLWPRACAPGKMADTRLRSRGLIKTIFVKGSDARSVQLAINDAFGTILRNIPLRTGSAIRRRSSSSFSDSQVARYLGLQQAWVPLRKMHKDSRLRFLAPAEMLTPALWDVAFLMSSVIMKATGKHRLYVTQPEAYLQDQHSYESSWSWQKLRELDRVYPDSESTSGSQDVPEADAAEACWAWNERLDESAAVSPTAALSLRQAAAPIKSHSSGSTSQQYFTSTQSPILSTSPIVIVAQSPLLMKGRRGSRPPHVRTASMPPSAPSAYSPSQGKRRVASAANGSTAYERRASPFIGSSRPSPRVAVMTSPAIPAAVYKRRSTRSPSLRPRTTPRWSLSRSPSLAPYVTVGGHDDRARGSPSCYATPFSNAALDNYPAHNARGGAVLDDYDDADMNCGSDTDPYDDSGMTHNADDDQSDIDVYEDEAGDLDDVDTDAGGRNESQGRGALPHPSSGPQLPEDEPWPGIPDNMSDGENLDPFSTEEVDIDIDEDDQHSDVSSQPSEYPSTQRAWHKNEDTAEEGDDDDDMGFKIHEDDDIGIAGLGTQWP